VHGRSPAYVMRVLWGAGKARARGSGDDVITASGSVCLRAYLKWHRFIVDPPPPLLLVERCS